MSPAEKPPYPPDRCIVCATTEHTSEAHLANFSHADLMGFLLAEQRTAVAERIAGGAS